MGVGTHLITHGMSKLPEYRKWAAMKVRCKSLREKYHHGKGISVCAEWDDFTKFYDHIGPMPAPEYSVDRWPNPAGNYEPGNVRWATAKQQANNRSSNRMVIYRGDEMSLSDAVEKAGCIVSVRLAWMRLHWDWDVNEAMETPPRKGNYRRKNRDGQTSCENR